MTTEIFGPVLAAYVYPDRCATGTQVPVTLRSEWMQTLALVNRTSPYGLTGAVFARDRCRRRPHHRTLTSHRLAVSQAAAKLQDAAGNFYV